jgi:hypothetical protein
MKKWPLCFALLLLMLSVPVFETGCQLAIFAQESPITPEQGDRIIHFVAAPDGLALAIQPIAIWLLWKATNTKESFLSRIGHALGVLIATDIAFFAASSWLNGPVVRLLIERLTRS